MTVIGIQVPLSTMPEVAAWQVAQTAAETPPQAHITDTTSDVVITLLTWGGVAAAIVIGGVLLIEGGSALSRELSPVKERVRGFFG